MQIDRPALHQIPALRQLWQQVFGDDDEFLQLYFTTAFSPQHCRCVTIDGRPVAAAHILDYTLHGRKYAYIYAVATAPDYRGRGLCRALMADLRRELLQSGYAGALLCPVCDELFPMYRSMGYTDGTSIREFSCRAATPVSLQIVSAEEYFRLRQQYLPPNSPEPGPQAAGLIRNLYRFCAGADFVLCFYIRDGILHAPELLGNADAAPGLLAALGCEKGHFRTPGADRPFTLCDPLRSAAAPQYFPFVLD